MDGGVWTAKQSNDRGNNQHIPQYANYWAPLTRKRHIPPHPTQSQHANDWAPRTRKRHRQEHRPQRPTERSDPTQHAKGRTGDRPGPRKETTTRRTVTQGGRPATHPGAPRSPPPHPWSPQPDPVYPCTAIAHNRDIGCQGDLVTPQGGRPDSQWASQAPEEVRKMVSARREWGTQRANPGAPAAQRLCPSTLRGTCTQWATTGAPDASRAATRPPCAQGIGHPGSQPWGPCGTAPLFVCARGIPRPVGHRWGPCGAGHLGLTHTETQRGRLWTA